MVLHPAALQASVPVSTDPSQQLAGQCQELSEREEQVAAHKQDLQAQEDVLKEADSFLAPSSRNPSDPTQNPLMANSTSVHAHEMAQLLAMGYNNEAVNRAALEKTGGNIETAFSSGLLC